MQGSIRRVMLVVREATPEATPLERFVFDLEWYIKQQDMPKDGPDFVYDHIPPFTLFPS